MPGAAPLKKVPKRSCPEFSKLELKKNRFGQKRQEGHDPPPPSFASLLCTVTKIP